MTGRSALRPFARGLWASTSIAAGYLPIAFSFGLSASQAGLSPLAAFLISAVVFAGASQFLLVALLASGGGPLTAVPAIWLINARHLFYGPTVLDRLGGRPSRVPLAVMAFGLTDEVMATAVARSGQVVEDDRDVWVTGLWIGAYTAWIVGTLLGSQLGGLVPADWVWLREALGFVLPALFLSLLLDLGVQAHRGPIGVAGIATVVSMTMLPANAALAIGMLAGAACGLFQRSVWTRA
ncbi:AzlC family ABC transporter permease [Rhodovibrio salinarum]|nr:AzlC family ABC transporter permease [Rhodovibrio salinarum]